MGNLCAGTTPQTEQDRRITRELHEAQRQYLEEFKLLLLGKFIFYTTDFRFNLLMITFV